MVIDHICFAVKDTDGAIAYWNKVFGYSQMTKTVINVRQKVKVTFMQKEGSIMIKLIEPCDDNDAMKKFVATEGKFHHICFRCDDINQKIEELTAQGLRLLVPPQPAEGFNNNEIAFMLARYGMNIEIIDTEEKSERI